MNFEYEISVIVPIYNSEKFIKRCIKTLMDQTFSFKKIDLILINDGSSDNSGCICQKYAQEYSNIQYFSHKNSGVSATRNVGIKNAKGKYILFLDSDDTITKTTINDVFDFFEKHYDEVDIVTYKLEYIDENNNVTTNARYEMLNITGVYSIDKYVHLNQSTMNICIKNDKDNPILFDITLSLAEDQFFILDCIMRKRAIGFVNTATYEYYRHSESATAQGNHPYYCFDQYLHFFELLCNKYKLSNGSVEKIAQALILYNFNWRMKGDVIFPYHLKGEEFEKAYQRVCSYVNLIDDDIILSSPFVDYNHKFYYLKIKNQNCDMRFSKTGYSIFSENTLLAFRENCDLVLCRTKIVDDNFHLSGFVKCPLLEFDSGKLFLCCDDDTIGIEIPLDYSSFSYYRSSMQTNIFKRFSCDIDINACKNFHFELEVRGHRINTVLFLAITSTFFDTRLELLYKNKLIRCFTKPNVHLNNSGGFKIIPLSSKEVACEKKRLAKVDFSRSKRAFIYRHCLKNKGKTIWLYCDRNGVIDNAYFQFKHDFNKNDGIERYYIVDEFKNVDSYFTKEEQKRLVEFKSFRHKLLFLNSDKILTSFGTEITYSPFDSRPLVYYSDLTHYQVIYLQHGILHATLPLLYYADRVPADKVVVSSSFEIDNFVNNYGYSVDNLIPSCMPRFDFNETKNKPEKKILFSPSWRKNLIGNYINNRRRMMKGQFLNSVFYKSINEFLNSKELHDMLEKYDFTLDFKNHPIFECYNDLFTIDSDRIHICSESVKIDEYQIMITDYSSIVFDFVYLNRPIIYFVPDFEQFEAGVTHTYRQLDLPLKEGFGPICYHTQALTEELITLLKNNCEPEKIYTDRMSDFFLHRDNKNCDRLYDYLIKD